MLGSILVLSVPFALLEKRARQKRLELAFLGRAARSDDQFHDEFFSAGGNSKEITVKVRQIMEEEFGADLSRLSPEDDLAGNLSILHEFDSLAAVELVTRLEEEFGIKIGDAEAEQTRTVADIIELVQSKTKVSD